METNFKVTTSADLSGLRQVSSLLDEIDRKARSVSATFARMQPPSLYSSPASEPSASGTAQRRQQPAPGGAQYNLNTPQGLEQWFQNVYGPEAGMIGQMMSGFQQKVFGSGGSRTRSRLPLQTIAPSTVSRPGSQAVMDWFTNLPQSNMSSSVRAEYARALANASRDSSPLPRSISDFYNQYGSQLGGPTGAPPSGGSGGGGKPPSGPPSAASQFGSALGGLAKQYAPWLTTAGAVMYGANQVSQGYNLWQQSSAPVDQLAHSMSTAATNVEQFRQAIVSTGAQFGLLSSQSAQMAQTLGQFFGNTGQSGIVSLVGAAAQFGQQNGLSSQQAAQILNASAALGITNGYGASMTGSQYTGMLSSAVTAAGMQGRQSLYYPGFTSAANAVVAQNGILANPTYLSGMYAQSVASMGDMRGGQLFSQLNSSVMGAQGTSQGILFAAMNKTLGGKLGNQDIVSVLSAQQGGLSSFVPGTHTTVLSSLYQYLKGSGFSQDQQVMIAAQYFGGNVNEAKLFLQNPSNFGQVATSTQNNQGTWYSSYGNLQKSQANMNVSKSNYGTAVAPFTTALNNMGSPAAVGGGIIGSLMLGNVLRGAGVGSGLLSGAGSALRGIGSGLGGLFSRFGGVIKGAGLDLLGGGEEVLGGAADLTGVGAIAGVPLNVLGAGTLALGTGMIAKNLYNNAHSSHASTATSHATQVQQQAQQRTNSNLSINTLTISNLKIDQVTLPQGMGGSILAGSVSSGNTYAPTSTSTSSGGFWNNLGNSIGNWFGGLFNGGGNGGNSAAKAGAVTSAQSGVAPWLPTINAAAQKYGVPASVLAGIMQVESGGHEYGPNGQILTSSAGALGIMQFMPGTAKGLGVNVNDPNSEIYGAAEYLKQLYGQTGSWNNAIMAYNGGPGGVGTPATEQYLQQVLSAQKSQTVHVSAQSATAIGHAVASAIRSNGYGGAVTP